MKFLAVGSLLVTLLALSACDAMGVRSASDTSAPAEVCAAAKPGTACDLVITEGDPPVVSHCRKQDDGSLLCPGQ
jgi:hypothetical protein